MSGNINLSAAPYFDDYSVSKSFYRVLYKPSVAVQVRELNQMQTIIQNQIAQFGSGIYKDGSVVTGCAFTFDNKYSYVMINDTFANNFAIPNVSQFVGSSLINPNGLEATIVNAIQGYQSQYPNLNTFYIKYLNSSQYPNNVVQSTFANGEILQIVNTVNNSVNAAVTMANGTFTVGQTVLDLNTGANGIVTFANSTYISLANVTSISSFNTSDTLTNGLGQTAAINTIYPVTQASVGNVVVATVANSTGLGYAFTTTAGVVFKDGFFLTVEPETIVVSKYSNLPDGVSVGFAANQTIVTASSDSSLLDNSYGSPNYTAPGADRLKVVPNLVTKNANGAVILSTDVSNSATFFSLCDFVGGVPVSIKSSPQFSTIETEMAARTYETNGDFVVNPFILTTQDKTDISGNPNTSYLSVVSTPGTGYSKGYRVQFINNYAVDLRKGTDIQTNIGQIVTANYGNYFEIDQYCGDFNVRNVVQVELHSVAKQALTNKTFLSTNYSSTTKIGTAFLRGFAYSDGTPGTPTATYNVYLFNIQMLPGQSASQVRSVIYNNGGSIAAVGDVVLTQTSGGLVAIVQDPVDEIMVHPFGQKAMVTNGFSAEQFVYRDSNTTTFGTNGQTTITLPSADGTGTEQFNYQGTYSTLEEYSFVVLPTSNGTTTAKSGTITINSGNTAVTGSSTSFTTDYSVGDYIYASNQVRQIVGINSNISMTVDVAWSASGGSLSHQKYFPAGVPINFSTSSRTISATTTVATLNLSETLSSTLACKVYFDVLRSNTTAIKKIINKTSLVEIDTTTHPAGIAGPWSLGLPDVLALRNVWIGSGTYSNTNPDITAQFNLDNGQRDAYYNLASISTNSPLPIGSTLLVAFDVFTKSESQGHGYFNAESYPIDDANTANTNAIQTIQIPLYNSVSTGSTLDLRDNVDFRPYAANTANVVSYSTISNITKNPANTVVISYPSLGAYLPSPDTNYEATVQHYLPRVDRILINTAGQLLIAQGVPSNTPTPPLELPGTTTIGLANVSPYPTLSTSDAKLYNRYDYAVMLTMQQTKRFTMADIGSLANRIDNLEYYTALSLLEQSAQQLQITSSQTGLTVFKNGILVDPFRDFTISNTNDPQFRIAIDSNSNQARPFFAQRTLPMYFSSSASTGVQQTGRMTSLPFTSVMYQSQPYSSNYRNCIEGNIFTYQGTLTLDPIGTVDPDLTQGPTVTSSIDLSANWVNLQQYIQSAFGTVWGNWVTQSSTSNSSTSTAQVGQTNNPDGSVSQAFQTTTTTTTSSQLQQVGTQLTATPSSTTVNIGNFVTNVSILPYIPAGYVLFKAVGMKPSTPLYAYFNNVPVSPQCIPVTPYSGTIKTVNGVAFTSDLTQLIYYDTAGNAYSFLADNWGGNLQADSTGTVYGVFSIPAGVFQSGNITFLLTDISNLSEGSLATTTSASAVYLGTPLSVQSSAADLQVLNSTINTQEVTQQQTITQTTQTQSNYVITIPPPPSPPWSWDGWGDSYTGYVSGGDSGPG